MLLFMLTTKEKDELLSICEQIYELAKNVREIQLSVLEESLQYSNSFMRLAVKLIFEGLESKYVKSILYNCISADGENEQEILTKTIITEGVLMIQEGILPDLIYLHTLSYLGSEYCSDFTKSGKLFKLSSPSDVSNIEKGQPGIMTQDVFNDTLNLALITSQADEKI